jgi:hypothetical protein
MRRNEKRLAISGMAGGLMLAFALAPIARAGLIVTLQEVGDPGGPFIVNDNGAGDSDGNIGEIQTTHAFPDFTTNITSGFSNKLDPSAGPEADLQISSLDITKTGNAAAHQLIITVSDNAFPFPGNSGDLMMLSSALSGTVTHSVAGSGDNVTFFSTANGAVSTPLETGSLPPASSTPISWNGVPSTSTINFVRGATFDLSSTTTLNLSGSGEAVNLSGTTTAVSLGPNVPEPAPAMLALLGVAPLLLFRRRRAPANV